MSEDRAVLAGGCFWGMQDLIRAYDGVVATSVGYTGGDVAHASYRNHGNHAEAIEIIFDPGKISYRRLLEFFFQIHDPARSTDRGTTSVRAIVPRFSMSTRSRRGSHSIRLRTSMLWGCGRVES